MLFSCACVCVSVCVCDPKCCRMLRMLRVCAWPFMCAFCIPMFSSIACTCVCDVQKEHSTQERISDTRTYTPAVHISRTPKPNERLNCASPRERLHTRSLPRVGCAQADYTSSASHRAAPPHVHIRAHTNTHTHAERNVSK